MVSKYSFKIILGAIGAAIMFIFGILAGRGRHDGRGTTDRIDDDIDRLADRQSELTDKLNDSGKQVTDIADELDGASTILDHSGASIKRAKDIVEELKKRRAEKTNSDGNN